MQLDENFYRTFLEEVNSLEKFRMFYSGLHSSELLGRDDPDVKRLIEAMAFFSAKTRLSGLRNIRATRRRLFEQFFSFLLTPVPAMGILQCEITGRFAEPAFVPKNSELLISAGKESPAVFLTTDDLRILPISLTKVETLFAPKEGFRLLLHFQTPYPRNDPIGQLRMYINYLSNYHASLQFRHNLKKHLRKASVFFDENVTESSQGTACAFEFDNLETSGEIANSDLSHPLQKVRTFFHFPHQDLYITFRVPAPPRNWRKFTICLDVDKNWPKKLTLNREVFQLFTVPVINLRHSMAQPIVCDGSKDRYPIRYGDVTGKFDFHSSIGVYQGERMTPIRPGILAGGSGSYEIEHSYIDGDRKSWLLLDLPDAFENPKKVAIDALWLQTWFSELVTQELEVELYGRNIEGVSWDILGEICPHLDNPLTDDGEALLQILSLQKKPVFHLDEIRCLLNSLGTLEKSNFKNVVPLLEKLEISIVPQTRDIGGVKHIYLFTLKEFDDSYRPLVELFLSQLLQLITACSSDTAVTLRAYLSGTKDTLQFE